MCSEIDTMRHCKYTKGALPNLPMSPHRRQPTDPLACRARTSLPKPRFPPAVVPHLDQVQREGLVAVLPHVVEEAESQLFKHLVGNALTQGAGVGTGLPVKCALRSSHNQHTPTVVRAYSDNGTRNQHDASHEIITIYVIPGMSTL